MSEDKTTRRAMVWDHGVVSVETIGIDRVVDGKVVEGWGQLDMLGLLTTIGAMVPATPAAEPAKS